MRRGRGGTRLNKSQRMQLKALACILGLILILLLLIGRLLSLIGSRKEEEPVPVIRAMENVWVMEVGKDSISVFEEGKEKTYPYIEGFQAPAQAREQLADITLTDEAVSQIDSKTHKINGKVLAIDDSGVELEGLGRFPLSEGVKGYRLYNSLAMCSPKDVPVGYAFADFVLENGEICGILLVKEEAMEYIRVLLKTGDYSGILHDFLTLTCDTDYVIRYGAYDVQAEELHQANESCTIEKDSAYFQNGRIYIIPSALTGRITLKNVERSQGEPSYRGILELVQEPEGMIVINEVLLEEYLYSVVPSEMPASYPKEALKAQAVCARTYAYRYMLHAGYPEYGAHVDDSTGYQVYNNIVEQEAAAEAVRETYGQLLYADGDGTLAETYYYSTSCGIGSDASVWQNAAADSLTYLSPLPINRGIAAALSESALTEAWQAATDAALDEALQAASVASDEASAASDAASDGAWQAVADAALTAQALKEESAFSEFIRGKNAEDYEVSEGWYRWNYTVNRLDPAILQERLKKRYEANPAQVLTQQEDGSFESSSPGSFNAVFDLSVSERGAGGVAKELIIETDQGTYKVLTEYSIRYLLCDGSTQVFRQDGSQVSAANLLPSGFFILETGKEKENVVGYTLIGGGYGHGVGMSQNGAKNMAADSMSSEEILSFFYHGCQLKNVYEK